MFKNRLELAKNMMQICKFR